MHCIKLVVKNLQESEQPFVLVQCHINTMTTASDKICLMVIGQIYWLSMKWLTRYSSKNTIERKQFIPDIQPYEVSPRENVISTEHHSNVCHQDILQN